MGVTLVLYTGYYRDRVKQNIGLAFNGPICNIKYIKLLLPKEATKIYRSLQPKIMSL